MNKRLIHAGGVVVLVVLVALVVWQGSFDFGRYGPRSIRQTYLLWAVSTLIFLLMVTLGFMLVRTAARLYIERQSNREGSRIKTKLVLGALALVFTPVFFLVLWSVSVLNRNLDKWFSRPAQNIRLDLFDVARSLERTAQEKAEAQAAWISRLPELERYLAAGIRPEGYFERLCREGGIEELAVERAGTRQLLCVPAAGPVSPARLLVARAPAGAQAEVVLKSRMPIDLAAKQQEMLQHIAEYDQLGEDRKSFRNTYIQLLALITLFILFFATWLALFLARQISVPISALLGAAEEVRQGNLGYRVQVRGIDELATLVRAFNGMTEELEANARELERRRRFTEAILESIPTGVISLSHDGTILRVNRALHHILPEEQVAAARRLEDLFPREDAAEIRYLMKRSRRTGAAGSQLDFKRGPQTLHLAATVAALEERSGFVLVLEDTSELLRAQRAVAWHEVARRVAHEIKNPLTPIALCAERIGRQLERERSAEGDRILRECAVTIVQEVESVRALVDEFSQLARFPAAQPVPSDLNEVVESALAVFTGRLDGIQLQKDLGQGLPPVNIDREQFKRVIVNLVDNAAEAMQDSLVRRLYIATQATGTDSVELVVSDTGSGVSPEDREKLFLPYFSTKGRGTGLGLAIVSHILHDHGAHIRVEDNRPAGARFIVEIPVPVSAETAELRA